MNIQNESDLEEVDNRAINIITEAANLLSRVSFSSSPKPGLIFPSRPTSESIYDSGNARAGTAVIFNQSYIKGVTDESGTDEYAMNLSDVLSNIGFDVTICHDFTTGEIMKELSECEFLIQFYYSLFQFLFLVSKRDHSKHDCLFVCIMTHGKKDKKIYGSDGEFPVQDLWENFIGDKCLSLIGKPKLFFIQACGGSLNDLDVVHRPRSKTFDCRSIFNEEFETIYLIPTNADLLVMHSTSEGFLFIKSLIEELLENLNEDLMTILTGVNRRVTTAQQSEVTQGVVLRQMPNIISTLTKKMFFIEKPTKTDVDVKASNARIERNRRSSQFYV